MRQSAAAETLPRYLNYFNRSYVNRSYVSRSRSWVI